MPDVLSLSWSAAGEETPAAEAALAKLAARGVSVIACSGDAGAYSGSSSQAVDGAFCGLPIVPTYPAASPWVTSAGGAGVARAKPKAKEHFVVCSPATGGGIAGGGGFGSIATAGAAPEWQAKYVTKYVKRARKSPLWPLTPGSPDAVASGSVACGADAAAVLAAINGTTAVVDGCVYGRGYPDVSL